MSSWTEHRPAVSTIGKDGLEVPGRLRGHFASVSAQTLREQASTKIPLTRRGVITGVERYRRQYMTRLDTPRRRIHDIDVDDQAVETPPGRLGRRAAVGGLAVTGVLAGAGGITAALRGLGKLAYERWVAPIREAQEAGHTLYRTELAKPEGQQQFTTLTLRSDIPTVAVRKAPVSHEGTLLSKHPLVNPGDMLHHTLLVKLPDGEFVVFELRRSFSEQHLQDRLGPEASTAPTFGWIDASYFNPADIARNIHNAVRLPAKPPAYPSP